MTLKKKNFSPRNLIKALQSTLIFFFFKKPPSRTHTHVFLEGACGLSCSVVSDSLQLNGLESCCLVTRPFGLFETLWTAAHQVSLSFSISRNLLKLMSIELMMPSNLSAAAKSLQSCPTLCDPIDHSAPGLPVHHQLLEFTQTHVH